MNPAPSRAPTEDALLFCTSGHSVRQAACDGPVMANRSILNCTKPLGLRRGCMTSLTRRSFGNALPGHSIWTFGRSRVVATEIMLGLVRRGANSLSAVKTEAVSIPSMFPLPCT